jgi:hypothetical protein
MSSSGPNTDGLHFDGPANDISITNCNFTTGDDAIALNCPEGYSGNISNVSVANCTIDSVSLMRLYTTIQGGTELQIDSVTVANCTGTASSAAFLIGIYAVNNPKAVLGLSVSNCQLTTPTILDLSADFSQIDVSSVTMTPFHSGDTDYGFARSYFTSGTPYTGSSLSFENCVIQRNSDVTVAALVLEFGSTIDQFELNGFSVQDPAGSSYAAAPELVNVVSGSIGQLVLDAVASTHIAAPVSAGGFSSIGSVSGAGVLATGWEFPDAVMANQTPYLSASSGQSSIKVGGVVMPYP